MNEKGTKSSEALEDLGRLKYLMEKQKGYGTIDKIKRWGSLDKITATVNTDDKSGNFTYWC